MKKLYYSIKEISELIDEEQHVLRYWEKEFKQLKPGKNKSGFRTYSEKDISLLKLIKKLIRDDKMPMKDAKEHVNELYKQNGDWDNSLFFGYEIEKITESTEPRAENKTDEQKPKVMPRTSEPAQNQHETKKEILEMLNSVLALAKEL